MLSESNLCPHGETWDTTRNQQIGKDKVFASNYEAGVLIIQIGSVKIFNYNLTV